jgi:uncharacterized membrane protein
MLVIVFLTGLAFESVGVATGIVMALIIHRPIRRQIPGPVPLSSGGVVHDDLPFFSHSQSTGIAFNPQWFLAGLADAALGAVAMTAWDLAMDPIMVAAGHWVWKMPGLFWDSGSKFVDGY